jgi:hypothetical protein
MLFSCGILTISLQGVSRGKHFFIGCSGWQPEFTSGHRSHSIPDSVDEKALSSLFTGGSLISKNETAPCSRIVPAYIGARLRHCGILLFISNTCSAFSRLDITAAFTHIRDGKPIRSKMILRPCSAERTIFVPVDASLRMAIVVPNHHKPHTHPMPLMTKASYDAKASYRENILAVGVLGATVKKVDNGKQPVLSGYTTSTKVCAAASTKLLHHGQTPGSTYMSLNQSRIKRDLITEAKLAKSPAGLGIVGVSLHECHSSLFFNTIYAGVYNQYVTELSNSAEDRYIHNVVTNPDGAILILTFQPFLASLVHTALSFQVDTTFKRVRGELNEWEVTIFHTGTNRSTCRSDYYKGVWSQC